MLSQAMELVTRAFYARSDLDLILSSPAAARRLFAVRIAAMAAGIVHAWRWLLAAPFIDVLVLRGGARWLAAYGVVAAMAMAAVALAVALTVALFRIIGPSARGFDRADRRGGDRRRASSSASRSPRSSLTARLSRFASCTSERMVAHAPDVDERRLVAGPRRPRRIGGAGGGARLSLVVLAGVDRRASRRASASTPGRRRRRRRARRGSAAALGFRPARQRRRCAARNGRCCGAIPG